MQEFLPLISCKPKLVLEVLQFLVNSLEKNVHEHYE